MVGSLHNPMHGFGEKVGGGGAGGGDEASVKSGLSGETLREGRRGSLVQRLFRRKERGKEEGGKEGAE